MTEGVEIYIRQRMWNIRMREIYITMDNLVPTDFLYPYFVSLSYIGARMNTETGQLYETQQDIAQAQARGEPLAYVSKEVADIVKAGHRQVAKDAHKKAKRARQESKKARKRNRK